MISSLALLSTAAGLSRDGRTGRRWWLIRESDQRGEGTEIWKHPSHGSIIPNCISCAANPPTRKYSSKADMRLAVSLVDDGRFVPTSLQTAIVDVFQRRKLQ